MQGVLGVDHAVGVDVGNGDLIGGEGFKVHRRAQRAQGVLGVDNAVERDVAYEPIHCGDGHILGNAGEILIPADEHLEGYLRGFGRGGGVAIGHVLFLDQLAVRIDEPDDQEVALVLSVNDEVAHYVGEIPAPAEEGVAVVSGRFGLDRVMAVFDDLKVDQRHAVKIIETDGEGLDDIDRGDGHIAGDEGDIGVPAGEYEADVLGRFGRLGGFTVIHGGTAQLVALPAEEYDGVLQPLILSGDGKVARDAAEGDIPADELIAVVSGRFGRHGVLAVIDGLSFDNGLAVHIYEGHGKGLHLVKSGDGHIACDAGDIRVPSGKHKAHVHGRFGSDGGGAVIDRLHVKHSAVHVKERDGVGEYLILCVYVNSRGDIVMILVPADEGIALAHGIRGRGGVMPVLDLLGFYYGVVPVDEIDGEYRNVIERGDFKIGIDRGEIGIPAHKGVPDMHGGLGRGGRLTIGNVLMDYIAAVPIAECDAELDHLVNGVYVKIAGDVEEAVIVPAHEGVAHAGGILGRRGGFAGQHLLFA